MRAALAGVAAAGSAAVRRFPGVAVCAGLAALSAVLALEAEVQDLWWGLLRVATLGIPLCIAVTLFCERHVTASAHRWALQLVAAAILVALYFLFERWAYWSLAQRYGHLSATFHLLVAVAPYLAVSEPRGFWQYNRSLLFRFLLATVYAGALFLGLALALAALDNLFGVEIPDLHYPRLFFLVGLLFHPLFFLAGVPRAFASLERDRRYPGGLRVFSQYVMLPLVALYVTILTVYLGKVLVTGSWPSGWISYLVSSLAVVGIFSLLMVHPDRMDAERGWVARYALVFWIAILPSVAMVLLALWQRVVQYGITERRYLLGVLAVWLAATALHAVITRTREIKGIPLTLALLGVATFAGPWSAYAVAERSQAKRLEEILTSHGALVDGHVAGDGAEVPFDEWVQAEAVVTYLVKHHGTDAIDMWHATATPRVEGRTREEGGAGAPEMPGGLAERVAQVMGDLRIRSGPSDRPVQLRAAGPRVPIPAAGFDLLVAGDEGASVVAGDTLRFAISEDGRDMVMWLAGRMEARGSLAALAEAAEALRRDGLRSEVVTLNGTEVERREVPAGDLVVELAGDRWSVRLALRSLTLQPRAGDDLAATEFALGAALLRVSGPPP